jgi:hypothetical protein
MPRKVSKKQEAKKESHPLAKDILNGFIGIIVFSEITDIFLTALTFAYLNLINPINFPDLRIIYVLFPLVALFGGFYLGYNSRKNLGLFYRLFNPRKQTILLSLVVSLIWLAIALGIGGDVWYMGNPMSLGNSSVVFLLVTGFIQSILLFPFSSVAGQVYENRARLKESKIPLLLIVLLNPVSLAFGIVGYNMYSFQAGNEPCGATIGNFTEVSPARDAGMSINETILAVDGQTIRYSTEIPNLSAQTDPKPLSIVTDKGNYSIQPIKTSSGDVRIGIYIHQKYCPR